MNEEAGTETMGVSVKTSENVKPNLYLMRKCFQEIISALRCKENQFNSMQELANETAKRLDLMRESTEVQLSQIREKEKEFRLLQDKWFKELELKWQELGLILESVKLWDEKFDEKEKLIEGLFKKIELERESFQKSMDEKFDEISLKERQLEDHSRELDFIKSEIDSRVIELQKAEEVLARRKKENELREKSLALKNEELEATKNQLELREKSLASRKEDLVAKEGEFVLREMVLASRKEELVSKENAIEARDKILDLKSKGKYGAANPVDGGKAEFGQAEVDAAQPRESRELRKESWKSGTSNTNEEFLQENESNVPCEGFLTKRNAISKHLDCSEGDISSNDARKDYPVPGSESDSESQYPEPEFNDFDRDRNEKCFAINQFWACYDAVDEMPRSYVQIKKVYSPEFKLSIAWLMADPEYHGNTDWVDKCFPVACGNFRLAKCKDITDHCIFSHQIHCGKGANQGTYVIHPRKGEIWALFRGWDIGRISNSAINKHYKYEIVEIVSDFVENVGLRAAYLDKIGGYVSLFQQTSRSDSFLMEPKEFFRFSHQIPYYRMNGSEREGVPEGSFELDPASLPTNLC